jgi:hypothetical protein
MTAARDPGLPSQGHAPAPTTAADEFDALFHGEAHRRAFSRACHLADPALPPDVEPFSFLSADLLHHISLALTEDSTLADLGCGRGGPGLWLARTAHARLVGIDFSPVAVAQAQHRATTLGVGDRAQFTARARDRDAVPGPRQNPDQLRASLHSLDLHRGQLRQQDLQLGVIHPPSSTQNRENHTPQRIRSPATKILSVIQASCAGRRGGGKMGPGSSGTPMYL